MFCRSLFCSFSLGHCVVCPSIYGFWLPLWYLRFTASDYPSGILDLLFLITSLWYLQTFLYLYISQSNFKKKYWTNEIWLTLIVDSALFLRIPESSSNMAGLCILLLDRSKVASVELWNNACPSAAHPSNPNPFHAICKFRSFVFFCKYKTKDKDIIFINSIVLFYHLMFYSVSSHLPQIFSMLYYHCVLKVDIKFSAHDAFLE